MEERTAVAIYCQFLCSCQNYETNIWWQEHRVKFQGNEKTKRKENNIFNIEPSQEKTTKMFLFQESSVKNHSLIVSTTNLT